MDDALREEFGVVSVSALEPPGVASAIANKRCKGECIARGGDQRVASDLGTPSTEHVPGPATLATSDLGIPSTEYSRSVQSWESPAPNLHPDLRILSTELARPRDACNFVRTWESPAPDRQDPATSVSDRAEPVHAAGRAEMATERRVGVHA